jgi:hypothetical protein
MRVGGVCVLGSRRELSTDTLGRYADTMISLTVTEAVSLPVTEAARRITTLCTRMGGVKSHHSAARVSKG